MKCILLTAAALVLTSPVLASGQLEAQLGVESELYTTSELVRMTFAKEERGGGRTAIPDRDPGPIVFSTTDTKKVSQSQNGREYLTAQID